MGVQPPENAVSESPQPYSHPVPVRGLQARGGMELRVEPDAAQRAAIAAALDLLELRKLRLTGRLVPEGAGDWRLEAHLGATVVQPCVVTLAPVSTRIEQDLVRRYLAAMPAVPEAADAEVEMDPDESIEPLGPVIDVGAALVEALALALPDYPRAPGAELGAAVFGPPGSAPLTDEAARPLAGLAGLRARLAGDDGGDDGGDDNDTGGGSG